MKPRSAVDEFIRIITLLILLVWCAALLAPFISMIMWAIIIAITIYPLQKKLSAKLNNRNGMSSAILTTIMLCIVAIPAYMMIKGITGTITEWKAGMIASLLPAPPPNVEGWPVIGKTVFGVWTMASENVTAFLVKYQPQLMSLGKWVFGALSGLVVDLLKFIVSMIIAGILMTNAKNSAVMADKFFYRILGERGLAFASIAEKTIRNVARGIIGVAFIQSLLVGIGLVLGDMPMAGILTLICLILAIVQIGILPVAIIVVIYAFSNFSTTHAIALSVYIGVISLIDNILKPILLGKGAPVPMIIVFLGSIGGFVVSGLIGLFVGAVVLSLGYKLLIMWIEDPAEVEVNME